MVIKHRNKWIAYWHENKKRKYQSFDNEQEAITLFKSLLGTKSIRV